jgi:RNA polymerase sigma-54 factor
MLQAALHYTTRQQFSARQQRAVHLLQMPNTEFVASLDASLASNPFLELDEHAAPPPVERPLAEDAAAAGDTGPWGAAPGSQRRGSGDADVDALSFVAAPTSLCEHLHGQLRLRRLDDRSFVLASLLCEALEDDGYLRTDPADLDGLDGLHPAPDSSEWAAALAVVQSLDPLGVGARGLVECLLLQLAATAPLQDCALAARLLTEAEPALRAGDPERCARVLGCAPGAVHRLLRQLRALDPHPGWQHGSEPVRYVVPDVLARRTRAGWRAVLNDAVVPRVQLNRVYADLYKASPPASEMAGQLTDAKWTMRNIAQRFSTILAVAQAIVRHQHRFLDHGALAMQPLGLRQIAEELGMHESTVSRVTHQKYIATPTGTFELGYFFSRGLAVAGGGHCSPTAVRELVGEIITRESGPPLSDVAIALQLTRRGIQVARRTVTKYRQELGLGAAGQRAGRQAAALHAGVPA